MTRTTTMAVFQQMLFGNRDVVPQQCVTSTRRSSTLLQLLFLQQMNCCQCISLDFIYPIQQTRANGKKSTLAGTFFFFAGLNPHQILLFYMYKNALQTLGSLLYLTFLLEGEDQLHPKCISPHRSHTLSTKRKVENSDNLLS